MLPEGEDSENPPLSDAVENLLVRNIRGQMQERDQNGRLMQPLNFNLLLWTWNLYILILIMLMG